MLSSRQTRKWEWTALGVIVTMIVMGSAPPPGKFTLDFEGIGDIDRVLEFYNGGTSGDGASGRNFGVSFSEDALGIIDTDAGGSGNFANEPSPDTIMFSDGSDGTTVDVPAGFTDFSVWYTTVDNSNGFVEIYDGLDGTGNLLQSIQLEALGSDPKGGDPNGVFNNWALVDASFEGVAKSIVLGMRFTPGSIGFDDMTFSSTPPCPWDLDDSGSVGILDLLALLAAWGPNVGHPADFNGSGTVNIFDLLILIANWGACP